MPPFKKDKKKGNQKNKGSSVCKYFQRGKCANRNCPYLHVKEKGVTSSSPAEDATSTSLLSTMLKLFFEKEIAKIYNPQTGALDLTALRKYPDLERITESINFSLKSFCVALCSCVRLLSPLPSVLIIADNQITSLHHFAKAVEEADLLVSLKALSVKDNQLADATQLVRDLKKFVGLVELDTRFNPVVDVPQYRETVKKGLPWLLGLDTVSLVTPPLSLAWPIFKDPSVPFTGEGAVGMAYTNDERHLLQFVQCSLFGPLESDPKEGQSSVDAVSDLYANSATFSFSLTSPSAAVSTPSRTASGGRNVDSQRDVVREMVAFRLRQTEASHNLEKGVQRSIKVACGRTEVCSQLVGLLYPPNFIVGHFIHESPHVVILDNKGNGPGATEMKVPISVITLHGIIMWRYRHPGSAKPVPNANAPAILNDPFLKDALVIKRNFTRVLVVENTAPGRWHITNDSVTLAPFGGRELEDADVISAADSLTPDNILFRDVHNYDVVFTPKEDPHRAALYGRRYTVPAPVVRQLCQFVHSDLELVTVLEDLSGVPMVAFEQCATLVSQDPMGAIVICRIGNKFGLEPTQGAALVAQHGYNWDAIVSAIQSGTTASTYGI
ncbi:hypothetical protein, conserved [Angomonas deanei]|uniref:C3H1-type domain-containing protein n=1 Tax=Angomonas deanei TaxID=59799 RepID=A0A7G2C9J8_9TRYP|nr:hypothetical protein, conserved [Angomonas deanei]